MTRTQQGLWSLVTVRTEGRRWLFTRPLSLKVRHVLCRGRLRPTSGSSRSWCPRRSTTCPPGALIPGHSRVSQPAAALRGPSRPSQSYRSFVLFPLWRVKHSSRTLSAAFEGVKLTVARRSLSFPAKCNYRALKTLLLSKNIELEFRRKIPRYCDSG